MQSKPIQWSLITKCWGYFAPFSSSYREPKFIRSILSRDVSSNIGPFSAHSHKPHCAHVHFAKDLDVLFFSDHRGELECAPTMLHNSGRRIQLNRRSLESHAPPSLCKIGLNFRRNRSPQIPVHPSPRSLPVGRTRRRSYPGQLPFVETDHTGLLAFGTRL